MSRRRRTINLATLIIFSFFALPAFAATNIDTSFGDEGTILLNSGLGDDEALAIGVQSDGMIVTAGYASNGSVKMLSVSRFTEDGEIDTDFNSAGTLTYNFGSSGDTVAHSLTIQGDDKIIISGSVEDSSGNSIIVARITDEGYLDTSYGTDGYRTFSVGSSVIETSNVLLNSDGDIIVSATVSPSSGYSYGYFIKTDSDGNVDTSFDDDGRAEIELASGDIEINGILLQSDNKILAAGASTVDGALQASLLRINEDGSLDSSYGSDGAAVLEMDGTESTAYDLAIDDDGNVVVVGSVNNGSYNQSFIGKLDSNGDEVISYGTSGIYTTTYSQENIAYSVTIQSNGTVTATGFMTSTTGRDVFVLSVTENSSSQISSTTYIATDIAEADDVAYSVTALDNGNVLTAGSSSNGDDLDSAILRFTDDTSLASSSSSSSAGVTAYGFRITTSPITDINRIGAMTGGTIKLLQTESCEDSCESDCGGNDNTCYNTCISTCVDDLTVSQRGVVFGTSSAPTYDESDEDEDSTTITDTTDSSSTSSDDSTDDSSDTSSAIFPDDPGYAIVRSGYTSDGSGTGTYESELTDITPGTRYYVRAYAVLSDDTVIYGNEYSFATDDACFIATAAYGSIFEKHVVLLRQFRDRYLLTSSLGEKFVGLYYHFSPRIADVIRDNDQLRSVVRVLLTPLVAVAFFALKIPVIIQTICIGAALLTMIWLILQVTTRTGFTPMKNSRIAKAVPEKLKQQSGFTLIELLVVLVIIGVLAGYIGPKIMGRPEEAKRTKAGLQIRAIETALKMYKLDNGSYPSTEQGLQALVEPPSTGKLPPKWRDGGYMEKGKVPLDPWGYEFVYLSPGVNADFDLSSYGGDGEAGGDGDAQDINNWEIE